MKTWHAVLLGFAAAILAIAALEAPLRGRRFDLQAKLLAQESELRRLAPIKVQVDDYQDRKQRLYSRVEWIERLRKETVCRWPLPGLDPSGPDGARIDGIVVEGATLTVLGTARDAAALERLATQVRGAPWAQEVKAGPNDAGAFGLFARIEAPKCHPKEEAQGGAEVQP